MAALSGGNIDDRAIFSTGPRECDGTNPENHDFVNLAEAELSSAKMHQNSLGYPVHDDLNIGGRYTDPTRAPPSATPATHDRGSTARAQYESSSYSVPSTGQIPQNFQLHPVTYDFYFSFVLLFPSIKGVVL